MSNQGLGELPKRLQKVMAQIRLKIEEERKQVSVNERRQCLSVFSDDELWQFREDTIRAYRCFQFVGSNEMAKQFKLSSREERIIAGRFRVEAIQQRTFYLNRLVNRLESKIKTESANELSQIEKLIFPYQLPQEFEWLKRHFFISFAFAKFARVCWPCLPDEDKWLLKKFLEEQEKILFEQAEVCFQNTLQETEYRTLQLVKAHLLYGIPPSKRQAMFEKGVAKIVPPIIEKVQRELGLTRRKSKTGKRGRPANDAYNRAYELAIKHSSFSADELLRRVDPQVGSLSKHSRQYRDKEKCLKQALNERHRKEHGKSFNWKARKAKSKKKMTGN